MKKLLSFILFALIFASCETSETTANVGIPGVGQGGSLARFAIANGHLFAVHNSEIRVFSLANTENPVQLSSLPVNAVVETIFPYGDSTIFIGTTSGMYIYDISSAPNMELLSNYRHIVSCDPVVANSKYAYVTLRTESNNFNCARGVNQLDIVNIEDLQNPSFVNSFPLIQPKGLGLYGDTLLICDNGLKVFNVGDPQNIILLDADEDFDAVDIIPNGNLMITVSETSLNQYRFQNGKLSFLSAL